MSNFKIGDKVCWNRAVEWKLRDTTGTVRQVLNEEADGRALYEVEFRFGRLHLHAGQISYLADLGRSEEQLAS